MDKFYHVDFLKAYFKDFARPNLYTVDFNLPPLSGTSGDSITKVEMSAKNVNIPAFDIGRQEVKRMGQRFFLPTSQAYGDIQMTLFCDNEYTQRYFLHNWLKELVYDSDTNIYKKMIVASRASMVIRQFDNKFNTIFAAEFRFIWPTSISEIQLSQESDSSIVEFPVTLSYSTYNIIKV